MLFSAYLYDTNKQLLASRSGSCTERLIAGLFHLLEIFPIGTVGILYDHKKRQIIGNYSRRIVE